MLFSTVVGTVSWLAQSSVGSIVANALGESISGMLPGSKDIVANLVSGMISDGLKSAGGAVNDRMRTPEQRMLNHDLQLALQTACREALFDIGGPACFPKAWPRPHLVPDVVIVSRQPSFALLWQREDSRADAIVQLFQHLATVELMPLDPPPAQLRVVDSLNFRDVTTRQVRNDFYNQILVPHLVSDALLLAEVPALEPHLRQTMFDRVMVHFGEQLKIQTRAWRAFTRAALMELRDRLDAQSTQVLGDLDSLKLNVRVLIDRLDQLSQQMTSGGNDPSAAIATVITSIGKADKRQDERVDALARRIVDQHGDTIRRLTSIEQSLAIANARLLVMFDRLPVAGSGQVTGTSPIALDTVAAPGEPPYKGMAFFDVADMNCFFGRSALTRKILNRLGALIAQPGPGGRFLAIIGASGSGKSSLARAGLVAHLRAGATASITEPILTGSVYWPHVAPFTPGDQPLHALARAVLGSAASLSAITNLVGMFYEEPESLTTAASRLTNGLPNQHVVLVVDQFEELFTACKDERARATFIQTLFTAVHNPVGPVVVVITLRNDFYAAFESYEPLRLAIAAQQEYIGSMEHDELREAIESPTKADGWKFEDGLVDLLLYDVGSEPGALPLLSHALRETWERRRGRWMILQGYVEAGRGARGDNAHCGKCLPAQAE